MEERRDANLRDTIATMLKAEPSIAAAYLYGSVARDTATTLSDVDLAAVISADVAFDERGTMLRRLTTRLERACRGHRFDIRLMDELPVAIAGRVVGEGVLVFERDPVARVAAEVRARMLYHDFLPFESAGTAASFRELKRRGDIG